jgi:hypothetical protein
MYPPSSSHVSSLLLTCILLPLKTHTTGNNMLGHFVIQVRILEYIFIYVCMYVYIRTYV